jgi:hypothetical protein
LSSLGLLRPILLIAIKHGGNGLKLLDLCLSLRRKPKRVSAGWINSSFHQVVNDANIPPVQRTHQRRVLKLALALTELGSVQVEQVESLQVVQIAGKSDGIVLASIVNCVVDLVAPAFIETPLQLSAVVLANSFEDSVLQAVELGEMSLRVPGRVEELVNEGVA